MVGTIRQPGADKGASGRDGNPAAARSGVRRLLLAILLVLMLAPPVAKGQAHGTSREAASLSARMRAFLEETADGATADRLVPYFPRRGDWTWYHTVHQDGAPDRVEAWRFPAAATRDALKPCGPAWESFAFQQHGQPSGVLSSQVMDHGTRWRRIGETRFVPPGAPGRSPVFVEWRREDGAWVVSSFGDESFLARRLPGIVSGMVRRDTTGPLPAAEAFAAGAPWYERNEPITFQGLRYIKYGNPYPAAGTKLAWIGVLGPIRVYAAQDEGRVPYMIYLPVAPGSYQRYETFNAPACP
jgi:hypothetical protein